ncbi:MAG: ABC transporter ATP-binding protein [Myxococcales bacterium]|nr:MAG: ABC transporter ATP-binding protein [Myxococcales bacterium]
MTEPLVELRDVHFAYEAERPVLAGASLRVLSGERVSILGGNGAGKTTLLHAIVGLIRPQAGEVIAFGEPRRREKDFWSVRKRVGLLFQDPDDQLFCPTVREDVAFGPLNLGRSSQEARAIVAETLERLRIAELADRVTHRLSGGEKRIVALATVLAMEPELLLLDEPTLGLDEPAYERLFEILAGLPQAMCVVSHDRSCHERLCVRAVELRAGRVVESRR